MRRETKIFLALVCTLILIGTTISAEQTVPPKRILAATSWHSNSVCRVPAPSPNTLVNAATANLDKSIDLVSSASSALVKTANSKGFTTVGIAGHSIEELKTFLSYKNKVNYPSVYLTFDMTYKTYTANNVWTAHDLMSKAGWKPAYSGHKAPIQLQEVAKASTLIVYENQQKLVYGNLAGFVKDVQNNSTIVKQNNPSTLFLVHIPLRSAANCKYTLDDAILAIKAIKDIPAIDGITIFNWDDLAELKMVKQALGRS